MSFIKPMNASPKPSSLDHIVPGQWVAQLKYDGIRIEAQVTSQDGLKRITPWSRYGKVHPVPKHVEAALLEFPNVVLDGELTVPGGRSYNVVELLNAPNLVYVVFDILEVNTDSTVHMTQDDRRRLLETIFNHRHISGLTAVQLAEQFVLSEPQQAEALFQSVLALGGEGLILKKRSGVYLPGRRPKHWVKMKDLQGATLTIVGFQPSRGTVQDRGPFAVVVLKDDKGCHVTVKTKNDEELDRFVSEADQQPHPAIGRRLCIEFQERTSDGSYRHPRWDRWACE